MPAKKRTYSLNDIALIFGIKFNKEHNALIDAEILARAYKILFSQNFNLNFYKEKIKKISSEFINFKINKLIELKQDFKIILIDADIKNKKNNFKNVFFDSLFLINWKMFLNNFAKKFNIQFYFLNYLNFPKYLDNIKNEDFSFLKEMKEKVSLTLQMFK